MELPLQMLLNKKMNFYFFLISLIKIKSIIRKRSQQLSLFIVNSVKENNSRN